VPTLGTRKRHARQLKGGQTSEVFEEEIVYR